MDDSQQAFVRRHYAPRAGAYLDSEAHAQGADLDQAEALVVRATPARLLDLGCGAGHVAYRVAAHAGLVVACDLAPEMLGLVRATAATRGLGNVVVQVGAAERLPCVTGGFEMVLCRYSAHHWADLDAGLREARRVLAPGGQALFIDSVAPAAAALDTHLQAIELVRDPSHGRDYRRAEWMDAAERAGFRVTGMIARRLAIGFAAWVARTRTPAEHISALRALQAGASAAVRRHFEIDAEGNWVLDTIALELAAAG